MRLIMTRIYLTLTTLCLVLCCVSCNTSYLDVSDELAEERDMERIFSTPDDVRKWHRNIYTGIPNTGNYSRNDIGGLDHPWAKMSDEVKIRQVTEYNLAPYTVSHSIFGRDRKNKRRNPSP